MDGGRMHFPNETRKMMKFYESLIFDSFSNQKANKEPNKNIVLGIYGLITISNYHIR